MSLLPSLLCRSLCGRAACLATLGPGWLRVFYQAHEVKQSLGSALWHSPGTAGQDEHLFRGHMACLFVPMSLLYVWGAGMHMWKSEVSPRYHSDAVHLVFYWNKALQ